MAASGVSKCTAGSADLATPAGVGVAVGSVVGPGVGAAVRFVVRAGVRTVGGTADGVPADPESAAGPVEFGAAVASAPPEVVQAASAVSVSAASGSALIRHMRIPFDQGRTVAAKKESGIRAPAIRGNPLVTDGLRPDRKSRRPVAVGS